MSLHVTPLSWIRSVYNLPDGYRHFCFAAIPDDYDPYHFGFKPSSGAKNEQLNRDCNHLQIHGDGVLDDLNQHLTEVSFPTTAEQYAYNDVWYPNGFRLPCYSYGQLTTLDVANIITSGYTVRSWAYVRSKQPGAVYPGLHEPRREATGRSNGIYFRVLAELTPSGGQLLLRVEYAFKYFSLNGSYQPATDPSKGKSECLWGNGEIPSFSLQSADIAAPVTITAMRGSSSKRYYIAPTLPSGMTLDKLSKEDPEITERIIDDFMSMLKVVIQSSASTNGSAYSREYDTIWSRTGQSSPKLASSKVSAIRSDLLQHLKRSKPDFPYNVLRGDATQSAAESAKYFAGNGIAYIQDLRRLKSTVFDLIGLLKGKKDLKSVANLWLSGRYGIKLTIQDTLDLMRGVQHFVEDWNKETSSCRGGSRNDDVDCHCKLYYRKQRIDGIESLDKLPSMLLQWDLYPTLENLWDLVPYSFVVDWFLGVGDILDGIDSIAYVSNMDIIGTCYSVKSRWVPPHMQAVLGMSGNFTATEYIRDTPKTPYQYIPHFSGSLPSAKNIVDGTALIIQRL